MPGPFVPLIVGGLSAGARILAGSAARGAVTQASRTAAKTTVKKAAKKTTSTAKKTTPRKPAAKKTAAKKPATKKTAAKKPAAKKPTASQVLTKGEKAQLKKYQEYQRSASMERGRLLRTQRAVRQAKIKPIRRAAVSTGASSLAYEGYRYASKVPKSTKNQMPIRPTKWNPNKGR